MKIRNILLALVVLVVSANVLLSQTIKKIDNDEPKKVAQEPQMIEYDKIKTTLIEESKIKREIRTDKAPLPIGPYSQAIEAKGSFVYLSGQIAMKLDGTMVEKDIEKQTRQVFENLKAVLKEAGLTFENVVKTTVLMIDLNDFGKMNKIYAEYFGLHAPARATFQVVRLPKDAMIEIDAVAVIPDQK